jgi:hypothetical protein
VETTGWSKLAAQHQSMAGAKLRKELDQG